MKYTIMLILFTGVSAALHTLQARSPGKSRKKPEPFLETFSPTKTTIQNNARGQTGSSRSRTPSPRPQPLPADPDFQRWITMNREAIRETQNVPPEGRASTERMLQLVASGKKAAQLSRGKANRDIAKFRTDPKHFDQALESADKAIIAGSLSTNVQNEAVMHYTNTDRNALVPDMIKSGARELARTKVRGSYKSAWHAEHVAKLTTVAAARRKPNDPGRGSAYALAAKARKDFQGYAQMYYDHHDEYKYTKQEMAGGSSSSEDEWEFHGAPRKYR